MSGSTEVWRKRLADGKSAGVVLLNMGDNDATVTAQWRDIGIVGPANVRDLWNHKDLGSMNGKFEAQVPSHGTVFVKITQSK